MACILLKGKTIVSLLAEYRVPTYQGNPLDSTSDFLGGLSKEALIGLHFHIPFEKVGLHFQDLYLLEIQRGKI